jgi:hypothetical protein
MRHAIVDVELGPVRINAVNVVVDAVGVLMVTVLFMTFPPDADQLYV